MSSLQDKLKAAATKAQADAAEKLKTNPEAGSNAKSAIPSFRPLRLKRFADSSGKMIYPNAEGLFVPKNQEELDILEYFMGTGLDHVELVVD